MRFVRNANKEKEDEGGAPLLAVMWEFWVFVGGF